MSCYLVEVRHDERHIEGLVIAVDEGLRDEQRPTDVVLDWGGHHVLPVLQLELFFQAPRDLQKLDVHQPHNNMT
jgi:hypothetical protein